MPGPSEMYRQDTEQRNKEYKKMEVSRNTVGDTAKDVTRLVALKVQIKTAYLSKSTKEALLAEVRAIERRLGIDSKAYSSGEF